MLKILIISDSKAGHENISLGLANYIQSKQDTEIVKIFVKKRLKIFNKIGKFICNNISINKKAIIILNKIFYSDFKFNYNIDIDLIISTGGDTTIANILLSKYYKKPNVFCSSLRGFNSNLFTFLVSIITNGYKNEIVVDLPPLNIKKDPKTLTGRYISLLIGGATKNHKFTNSEFINLVENMIYLARQFDYKLFLSTSRRTPTEVENQIQILVDNNSDIFERVVLFNKKPEKVINYYFSNSDVIFVTEDSGSMISEAILSEKHVYSIRPKICNLDLIFNNFIINLTNKDLLKIKNIDDLKNINLSINSFNKLNMNPAELIYNKIKEVI